MCIYIYIYVDTYLEMDTDIYTLINSHLCATNHGLESIANPVFRTRNSTAALKREWASSSQKTKPKIILPRTSPPSLGRDTLGLGNTLGLGTPGTLWDWALQGDSEILRGRSGLALWGDSGVGHSRKILGLGTSGTLWVGHSRQTLGLGTLQGPSRVGHSRDTLGLGTPGMSEEFTGRGEEFRARSRVEFKI